MDPKKIDISVIARDLKLAPENVEAAIQLLDEGNTIPFVTRFRKDLTGGLNEEQLLAIKTRAAQLRALGERKATILRAVESQGELTDELRLQIEKTHSSRRLEDIYAPFKTKKQSRASLARQQGLAPLAEEILNPESGIDFATRATDFVRVDKGLNSVDDVIKGVSDLLSERFAENEALRSALRKHLRDTGKLTSAEIVSAQSTEQTEEPASTEESASTDAFAKDQPSESTTAGTEQPNVSEPPPSADTTSSAETTTEGSNEGGGETEASQPGGVVSDTVQPTAATETEESAPAPEASTESSQEATGDKEATGSTSPANETTSADAPSEATTDSASPTAEDAKTTAEAVSNEPASTAESAETKPVESTADSAGTENAQPAPAETKADSAKSKARPKKKKKKKKTQDLYKDYFDFAQPINKLPHHRVLAINRGERAGKIRVKIKTDTEQTTQLAQKILVPQDHPSSTFLGKCANETLSRSLFPSVERELRRELTENAERHAVEVFASNLRNLLLQPPIRNRVVLAIDPGYKRGCSVAVVDACGNLLDSGQVFVVGNKQRRDESKGRLRDWVQQHRVEVIAIGNGSGCRQVEQLVSDTIAELLSETEVRYIIINEAGTNVYSTSEIGREELPDISPAIRSAVSIGRRLIDPLSEFVKISPANVGVGLYQHDIKAKHLGESLEAVVQSCVNRVGVDVNTASAALLRFVSGLNALTARRVIEYRKEHGRFNTREELKNVSGIGETTYVQAAGFLRIHGGENPLDATGIHPECYPIAEDILNRISATVDQLFPRWLMQPAKQEIAKLELEKAREQKKQEAAKKPASAPAESTNSPVESKPDSSSSAATSETTTASISPEGTQPPDSPAVEASVETEPSVESTPVESTPVDGTVSPESTSDSIAPDSVPPEPVVTESSDAPESAAASESSATQGSSPEVTSDEPTPSVSAETTSAEDKASLEESRRSSRREFEAKRKELIQKLNELNVDEIAAAHNAGKILVNDVIMSLKRPAWDPRDKAHKPLFRRGILKIDDLKPEMQLDGQIINVVDFGVFVDIGLGESSLVHISQLSTHYISDPFKHFAIGNVLKVWVTEVDTGARRIKLTAVKPGTKKAQRRPRRERKETTSRRSSKPNDAPRDANRQARGKGKPGKYDSKRRTAGKPDSQRRVHRRGKPKEIPKITDKMLRGDEPMKTFADLAQFVRQKPEKKKTESIKTDQGAEKPPADEQNNSEES